MRARLLLAAACLALLPAPAPVRAAEASGGCGSHQVAKLQTIGGLGVDYCPGVRPGANVRTKAGSCTLNFAFQGSDGFKYIGTAGHCILEKNEEKAWPALGSGPGATDDAGKRFGDFVYAALEDIYPDFALIRIRNETDFKPQMCNFGGPTGMYTAQDPNMVHTRHSGNGLILGYVVPGRSGVALNTLHPTEVHAFHPAMPGDSGSGVTTTDGKAIGVLVGIGELYQTGRTIITRMPPQVARASQVLGIGLTLITAPVL